MEAKKIAKLVKVLVEAEVAKQQEKFLTKTFPKILEEQIKLKFKKSKTIQPQAEVDPFSLAESVLNEERKTYSKNSVLNEAIASTKPFNQMDKQVQFNSTSVAMGGGVPPNLKHSMAHQMGYGNLAAGGASKPQGLGVKTGLAGLDRVLNRDNSSLVKAFNKQKNWRPGQD